MKKILLVLVFSLLSLVSIFAENVELKIHLLNGTVNALIVDSSIDEIYGFKMHLQLKMEVLKLHECLSTWAPMLTLWMHQRESPYILQ